MSKKEHLIRTVAGVFGIFAVAACAASTADDPPASGEGSDLCAGKCDQAAACTLTGGFAETVEKGPHDVSAGVALTLTAADPIANDALAAVLDALDAAGVRASFFVSKSFLTNLSAVNASRMRQRGDLLAPYVYIDYTKTVPSSSVVQERLFATETELAKHNLLSPAGSIFFRFPYGGSCAHQDELHARIGRVSVGWHVHDQGLASASATSWRAAMSSRVGATKGGVVLLHLLSLTKKRTTEAFAPWVKELAKKFTLTTLDQRANFPGYASRLDGLTYRVPGPSVKSTESGDLYAGVTEPRARVFVRARSQNGFGWPAGELELVHSEGCAAGTCKEQVWSTNENAAHCMDPSPIADAHCSITSDLTGKGALLVPSPDFGDHQYLGKGLGNGYWTLRAPATQAGLDLAAGFDDWEIVITGTNPKAERVVPMTAEWSGEAPIPEDQPAEASAQATLKSGGLPGAPVLFKKSGTKLAPVSVEVELQVPLAEQTSLGDLSLSLRHADWPEIALDTHSATVSGTKVRYTLSVDLSSAVFDKESQMVDASRSFTRSPLGAWSVRASSSELAGAKLTAFRVKIN